MRPLRLLCITALLPLAACNVASSGDGDGTSSSSTSAASSVTASLTAPTQNVSYTGIVQPAGISVFQQGTHRLLLPGNHFILLESTDVVLDSYVNQRVEAFGSVQPTVEAGGTIMTVERMTPLDAPTGTGSVSSASEPMAASATSSSASSDAMMAASSSDAMTTSSAASAVASVMPTINRSAEMEARIAAIAAEDLSPGRWTQQYCSSHMGFCTPIHKNWWFKSFGATTSALWHVEISNAPIELLGDGPLAINVVTGTLASRSATDGQVRVQGDTVIGFRSRDDETHYEVIAPAELEASVQYVTRNIVEYAGE